MSDTPRSYPAPGRDPQQMDRRELVIAIAAALNGPELTDDALRDALEILASDGEPLDTFAERAPFQCFHCGVVLKSRGAQRVHFGETPERIPLCLAPDAARTLLREVRVLEVANSWREISRAELQALGALIETACADSAPEAPRIGREAEPAGAERGGAAPDTPAPVGIGSACTRAAARPDGPDGPEDRQG